MKSMKFNPGVASKRREKDIMKLKMSNYKVTQSKENPSDFIIQFPGPKDTLYEGGLWTVHVLLPSEYPFRSPSIGFNNKIFHPNVDEASGSVCLDVINQTWSPMYDLVNIFDSFLPQLLNYPNPTDPLNPDAAAVMLKDEKTYSEKVKEYVQKYAQEHLKCESQLQAKQTSNSLNSQQQSSQSTASGSNTDGESNEDNSDTKNQKIRKQSHQVFADLHEKFEEEDNISNISLDNLSELSDVSNLEIEELNY